MEKILKFSGYTLLNDLPQIEGMTTKLFYGN